MYTLRTRLLLVGSAAAILLGILTPHAAGAITFVATTPIAGDSVPVTVTLVDAPGGNGVDVTVSIPTGQGDLLGFFGNANPETLVPSMAVVDPTGLVTQWQFAANQVWKVGGGNVMSPVKNWDFGLRFASQGSAGGAVTSASFRLMAPGLTTASLTNAFNQGWRFGIRIQSTHGPEGSAKIGVSSTAPPVGEAPTVEITAPADGALLDDGNVTLTGTVTSASPVTVSVNGVAATVTGSIWSTAIVLADGAHTLTATASNAAGPATDSVAVTVDSTPPAVTITAPSDGTPTTAALVTVTGTVTDASPIASFTVDGVAVPLTAGTFSTTVTLGLGANPITAEATDAAGNTGAGAISVTRGEAPTIAITSPADGLLTNQTPIPVTGTVGGTTPISVVVNGVVATVTGSTWTASVALVEGANTLTASTTNGFGSADASVSVTLDTMPPLVAISAPADGTLTAVTTIDVTGTVSDATSGVAGVAVNGVAATVSGESFSATIPLSPGANPIAATAIDVAGNSATTPAISVTRGEAPAVAITSPPNGFETPEGSIEVTGTVSGTPPITVIVNGNTATVTGGSFHAAVPLVDGPNTLVATATNGFGTHADSVSGTRTAGVLPLAIEIETPPAGALFSTREIDVAGAVSDPVAAVRVNGVVATVTGQQWIASGVPLTEGANTLTATATRTSATATAEVAVTHNAPPQVVITSPVDGGRLRVAATEVEGVVDDLAAYVDVNGVVASVGPGGRFTASDVSLALGENPLLARAIDPYGATGTDEVRVTRDDASLPPLRLVFVSLRRYPFVVGPETEPSPLIAEDAAEFRAALGLFGFPGDEFEPPIERIQYSYGGHLVFVFAEEPGDVDFFENDVFLDGPVPLQPIEDLPNDFLFQFGDLDPALIPALLPVDFEARYFTTFDRSILIEGGEPPQGDSTLRAVATHGGVDELLSSAETRLPFVEILSPADGSTVASGSITLTGTAVSEGNLFQRVRYVVQDTENYIQIATGSAPLASGRFTIPDVPLGTGRHCLFVTALDAAGNSEGGSTCITVDADAPPVQLVSPRDGEAVLASSVAVDLNFAAPMTLVSVNGTPDGRSFPVGVANDVLTVALALGPNVITLVVDSGTGPVTLAFTIFRVESVEPIAIVDPRDDALRNLASVPVTVRAPLGTIAVIINGAFATRAADGVSYVANIAIRSGDNPVTAIAYPFGQTATSNIRGDLQPPRILELIPADRVTTANAEISLAGFLDEAARVTAESPAGTASASTRFDVARSNQLFGSEVHRFDVVALPLLTGTNQITVRARDAAGNETVHVLTAERVNGALQLVSPAAGSSVADLVTSITLRATEAVTIDAWVVAGRPVPALGGVGIAAGVDTPVTGVPLAPGVNDVRIVSHRAGGASEVLNFQLTSTAADYATVAGQVTDTRTGAAIGGALVSITAGGVGFNVVTDANGNYRAQVVPGSIAVAAVAEGYAVASTSGSAVAGGSLVADVGLASTGIPAVMNEMRILVPPAGAVTDFEMLTVVGTVLNPNSSVTVNGIAAQVVGNRFTAKHVPLAMGANTIQASASVLGLPVATRSVGVERSNTPVLQVKLFSPPEGARVPGGGLVVRGFVSAKDALLEIATFGSADIVGGVFEANEVFLAAGSQSLRVAATTPDGAQSAQDQSDVEVDSSEPALRLRAAPASGEAPLHTTLSLAYGVAAFAIDHIDFDTNGDAALDIFDSPSGDVETDLVNPSTIVGRAIAATPGGVELSASTRVHAYLPATTLQQFALGNPVDLARGPNGTVYVLDGAAGRVSRYDAAGAQLESFGSAGVGPEQLLTPQALAVSPNGRIYVADTGNDRIQVFNPNGAFERTIGSAGHSLGQLDEPRGVAAASNRIYVADSGNARIQIFDSAGAFVGHLPLAEPRGLHRSGNGQVFVTSPVAGFLSLSDGRLEDVEEVTLLQPAEKPSAPTDVSIGNDSALIVDSATGGVVQLWPSLEWRRSIDPPSRAIRAVLPSERAETESIYVADGARVTEIGLPVPSPIPTLQSLKDRLAASDIEGALGFIGERQRPLFRQIYEQIAPALPEDAASMQTFSVYSARESEATAVIHRTETRGGTTVERDYPVSLRRQPDGAWKVTDY